MHPVVYVMLIAGGALAHYRVYDTRNLLERDESENEINEGETLECPVCEDVSPWQVSDEECPIISGGKTFKRCKYGIYNNPKCGNRRDCFRGPGEKCTEKHTVDHYGQRCAPGYYCHPTIGRCTGPGNPIDSKLLPFIGPNQRYRYNDPLNPSYSIRVRRAVL